MKKIFISGSMSIKKLSEKVIRTLDRLIEKKYQILVGDAVGIDELIQKYFAEKNYNFVSVYSIANPRVFVKKEFKNINIKIDENIKDLRERQTEKDISMTNEADVSFVIWDGASKGTYNNIIRSLKNNKEIQIFYNGDFLNKESLNIENVKNIFSNHRKYSLSEYIKEEKSKIKNVKKMRDILIKEGILNSENTINREYKNNIEIKINRGKQIIKFPKSILDKYFLEVTTDSTQMSLI